MIVVKKVKVITENGLQNKPWVRVLNLTTFALFSHLSKVYCPIMANKAAVSQSSFIDNNILKHDTRESDPKLTRTCVMVLMNIRKYY